MTGNKHESKDVTEDAEDTVAGSDADTATETADEAGGKHAAADEPDAPVEAEDTELAESAESTKPGRKTDWSRVLAFAVLPALAFVLAVGAGVLKFLDSGVRDSDTARVESLQAAKDSTIALLSYKPETVEQQLTAARDRLTGEFKDQYTDLTTNVVIPGAKQKQISALASVPAAASVSANPGRAVALLFVNQTVTIGNGVPSDTASSVRVTMDKVGDRWLISKFDPV